MQNVRQVMRALAALPFILAAGCFPEGATDPLSEAGTMVARAIPPAASLVGSPAAPAPSVFVSTNGGKAVAGAPVTFTVTAGNGTISASLVKTDKQGIASVAWTYGSVPGANVLTATLGSLPPVTFTVTTTGGGPAEMTKVNDGQSAPVGEALPQPVSVIVRNASGQPVAGAIVVFTAKSGSTLSAPGETGSVVSTDAEGRAQTVWTMATVPGQDTLTAAVDGLPTSVFVATAVVGAPAEILTTGGDQTGTVDLTLATPLGITVRDRYHNAIPGLAVTWAPQAGGAATPATDMTDASGHSSTQWRLPVTAGDATLNASAGSLVAVFHATAVAGAPTQLIKMASSDGQAGDPGQPLAQPIAVTVRDAHDNPVPNVSVSFSTASGSANPATATTTSTGQANTTWTLGTTAGSVTMDVSAAGVANPVTFTATVNAPDPCSSHGVLVIGTAVTGNLANSQCASPLTRTFADIWTLNLNGSTPLEIIQTSDVPNEDMFLTLFRGQFASSQLVGANDDMDPNNGNYNSDIRFLGGAGQFLVGASFVTSYIGDRGGAYHLTAKSWTGAVTACQDVYAVNGTSTSQQLDNDDCPASGARNHSDRVFVMLKPGETVTVSMSSSVFDAKLEMEDGYGAIVASDDNGGGGTNARLTYTAPATGSSVDTYSVYATSVLAAGGGSYSFAVSVTPPAAPAPAMSTTSAATSSPVGPGVQKLFGARKVNMTLR
ncbi:MAG TPA: Ig-like domain-containing protein [Gemmatimonadaceae bacterium]|nr:Ig-like domain-containing protein [Gemmatimonadaceae bacterium]